jgi:signal transduction histidine kinase
MRLSVFIRNNNQPIISEWERFAKTLTPASDNMTQLQLKDHIEEILLFIADDIESPQSASQQFDKSHGKRDSANYKDSAAETHGALRHDSGFDIVQMVSEYRALRGSVVKLWTRSQKILTDEDMLDLTRFHESIDQALAESVVKFMDKIDYSKDLLLGVLGHDIRSPLGAIKMSAQLLARIGPLNEKQNVLANQIEECSSRITNIVTDLLDLTRARIGTGLAIIKKPMNMEIIAQQIVGEMRIQYPDRTILLETTGNVDGEWDMTRLGQVFSNLINNAIQYGATDSPISVMTQGNAAEVILSVHNSGEPIPTHLLTTLFDSFTRGKTGDHAPDTLSSNLGLGLFITREIILSHEGNITVTSNEHEGTSFTVTLPKLSRHPQPMDHEANVSALTG